MGSLPSVYPLHQYVQFALQFCPSSRMDAISNIKRWEEHYAFRAVNNVHGAYLSHIKQTRVAQGPGFPSG